MTTVRPQFGVAAASTLALIVLGLHRSELPEIADRWSARWALLLLSTTLLTIASWCAVAIAARTEARRSQAGDQELITGSGETASGLTTALFSGAIAVGLLASGFWWVLPLLGTPLVLTTRGQRPQSLFLAVAIGTTAGAGALECCLGLTRHSPVIGLAHPRLLELGRDLYLANCPAIQYDSSAAQYDSDLAYTLLPSIRFRQREAEFDVAYETNSLGLRDSEESLQSPEVVFLGDSFTMGWGVPQESTFAKRLAARTGLRTLNAGISSYGTVRELGLLRRIDLSSLRVIVIQYCTNDFYENRAQRQAGAGSILADRASYESAMRVHASKSRYQPLEYLDQTVGVALRDLIVETAEFFGASTHRTQEVWSDAPDQLDPAIQRQQVEYFLSALGSSPVDLSSIPIIVTVLNPRGENAGTFLEVLDKTLQSDAFSDLPGIHTVDCMADLQLTDWFVYDAHINSLGHDRVSATLAACMNEILARHEDETR